MFSIIRIRRGAQLAVCLALFGLLAVPFQVLAQEPEPALYSGDGSDATTGGSHQVIVTRVAGIDCLKTTFEGGGQLSLIHPATGFEIPGLGARFPDWLTLTSGDYANNPSVPTVAFWLGGVLREITFVDPVSSVSFFYASAVSVEMYSYDAANNPVASIVGPPNFTGTFDVWDPLGIDVGVNLITRVTITGASGQTGIDDFESCRLSNVDALIDIVPDTLNVNSKGKWVTVYITLPEGFNVADIDTSTIEITSLLGNSCAAAYSQSADLSFVPEIGDHDEDGIPDLTVKFDRQILAASLCIDDVVIQVEGDLFDGEHFVGSDKIRVIDRGGK